MNTNQFKSFEALGEDVPVLVHRVFNADRMVLIVLQDNGVDAAATQLLAETLKHRITDYFHFFSRYGFRMMTRRLADLFSVRIVFLAKTMKTENVFKKEWIIVFL